MIAIQSGEDLRVSCAPFVIDGERAASTSKLVLPGEEVADEAGFMRCVVEVFCI